MNMGKPRISVIVITYNQENLIGRALDSVLCQSELVCEIIVSDDCSKDKTWEVIHNYKVQHPALIKPFRNEHNLGIFGNLESTWSKPTGDIIIYLAGDDIICYGLFEEINKLIIRENIDFTQGSFCLYTDTKSISTNGKERIQSNHIISKGFDAKSLKIRGLIGSSRGILFSRELFKRFKHVEKDLGICTDGIYDMQVQLFSDKNYYTKFIGAIYYSGIGISSITPHIEGLKSLVLLYDEFYNTIDFTKKDKFYILYKKASFSFFIEPSFKDFIKTWKYYFISINIHYGINIIPIGKLLLKMVIAAFKRIIK